MAKQNKTTLKGYFETGDIPNQNQYADLIDSNLNLSETSQQELAGGLNVTGDITSSGALKSSGDISCGGNSSCNGSFSCDGNISSSADVISNNITASGNISASGFISASNIISRFNVKAQTLVGTGVEATETKTTTLVATNDDQNLISTSGTGFTIGQANYPLTITPNITASGNISASNASTASFGSMILSNLPTTTPTITGSLWLSGSNAEGTSKHLMVFTG